MSGRVTLEPVMPGDREHLAALEVAPGQRSFVAPNAKTLEEAGLDGAFFMGSDLTGALKGLHADLGIA